MGNISKKQHLLKVNVLVGIMILLSSVVTTAGDVVFSDVSNNHWAHKAIEELSAKDVVNGYPDGTFLTEKEVSYGEFLKMMSIACNVGAVERTGEGHWATPYYQAALERGYFSELVFTGDMMDRPIPRKHVAMLISRASDNSVAEDFDEIAGEISDMNFQSQFHYDVVKVYAEGILHGYEDGTFRPEEFLSRGEASVAVYRLMDKDQRQMPLHSKTKGDTDFPQGKYDSRNLENMTTLEMSDTSVSTLRLRDLIDNPEVLLNDVPSEDMHYEIIESLPFNFSLEKTSLGNEYLYLAQGDILRDVILVTGREATRLETAGGDKYYLKDRSTQAFPRQLDYLGIYAYSGDTVLLVKNPLVNL